MTRLATLLAALLAAPSLAHTYDEPWHEQVAAGAAALARVEVLEVGRREVRVKTERLLAGAELPAELTVAIPGTDDHPHPVLLAARERYYLFLWRTEDGGWSLPTPTAGFAHERPDGLIQATYRHSYHQGLVPRELYEETQAAIFRARHGEPAPAALVARLADELLAKPPDGLPDDPTDEANLFFRQHAALETVFHLGWGEVPPERALALLEPFLQSDVWHVQVSAVRALERVPGREARTRMMRFLRARGRSGFAQVMAVWALRRANARGLREELQRLAGEASDEEVGFGGSIMDPRVGTRFPRSVKDALEELVAEWAEEGR